MILISGARCLPAAEARVQGAAEAEQLQGEISTQYKLLMMLVLMLMLVLVLILVLMLMQVS